MKTGDVVYIYGAGHYGVLTALDVEKHGFKVKAFIDKDASKIKTRLGMPVMQPEEILSDKNRDFKIIIAIQNEEAINEIIRMFKVAGLRKGDDFILSPITETVPTGYFDSFEDFIKEMKERYDNFSSDEKGTRYLANSWNGIVNKPQNLRFIENAVPIVLCADENYAPYMAVMLQSLMDYSNPQKKYHFIIFERGFATKTKDCLIEQALKFPHCTIDFISMQSVFDGMTLATHDYFSIDIYSRLFIPYWLDKYPKVIYLDSDMIAMADISELYDLDIQDHCIGAVIEPGTDHSLMHKNYSYLINKPVVCYLEETSRYLNSGLLVFDTQKFREKISCEELFRFAIYITNSLKKHVGDQDVLNILFKDGYYILPSEWNFLLSIRSKGPAKTVRGKAKAKIVHFFSPIKPWQNSPAIANYPEALAYLSYAKNVPLFRDSVKIQQGEQRESVAHNLPLNVETFGFAKAVPFFDINVLRPHIYEDGVILYGAGDNCLKFMTSLFLRNIKANILCVADVDESKHGKSILELPIVAVEELQKYNKQTPILITTAKGFRQIADNLKNMQFSNLFYYDKTAREYTELRDKYLKKNNQGKNYFDIDGVLLPDIEDADIFTFVHAIDEIFRDNFYFYADGNFDVNIKNGDIVIDAGAFIGDFSAYCANKGTEVYAFEPTSATFALLEQTVELNKPSKIYPVKKGLSSKVGTACIEFFENNSGGNSIVMHRNDIGKSEEISLTTLDIFVAENNIKKIDFIKADIEGAERDMLRGATNILKTFAPKLAICTYHLPDDPRVLEDIILEINPKYKVIHLKGRLFACVPGKH